MHRKCNGPLGKQNRKWHHFAPLPPLSPPMEDKKSHGHHMTSVLFLSVIKCVGSSTQNRPSHTEKFCLASSTTHLKKTNHYNNVNRILLRAKLRVHKWNISLHKWSQVVHFLNDVFKKQKKEKAVRTINLCIHYNKTVKSVPWIFFLFVSLFHFLLYRNSTL